MRESKDLSLAVPTTIEVFAGLLQNKDIEISRIRELMDVQREAERREAERLFIAAFNRIQPKLPRVVKLGKIDLGRGKPIPFAKWEDVDSVIRPILAEEGMTLSFVTRTLEGDKTVMVCRLSHVAGHTWESEMPLFQDKGPGRNEMQAWGSGRQYTKRYLACDLLNIITVGEDNDAAGTGFISEQQTNTIIDMMAACEMDQQSQSKFLELMQSESVSELQKRDYPKAMSLLQAKLKKLRGAQ